MYVLKCMGNGKNHGKYVSVPGHKKSYTKSIDCIRFYSTKEEAQRDACGNEVAVEFKKGEK